jgi:ppGpp synthetase/RelA/SpoT-type nucleotidyltranferase
VTSSNTAVLFDWESEQDEWPSWSLDDREILSAMAWVKPEHAKSRVDWAGEVLVSDLASAEEALAALQIVNNWRAVQAIKMTLKKRAQRVCPSAVIAQRLKRLPSIAFKLAQNKQAGHHMKLSQMQDVGGCRAIVDTVAEVSEVAQAFEEAAKKNPLRGSQFSKLFDYIGKPKANGYRGVHLVYKFRSDSPAHECYNDQRIEIQIRTKLQHYWATAVETYSAFSGQALKSNIGPEAWKRFFALVATAMAIREECATVECTPVSIPELVSELRALYVRLNVYGILSGWAAAMKSTEKPPTKGFSKAVMFLLSIEVNEQEQKLHIRIWPFSKNEVAKANEEYAKLEKERPEVQAVLVSVDSVTALRTAYPNYFADTTEFLSFVSGAISEEESAV